MPEDIKTTTMRDDPEADIGFAPTIAASCPSRVTINPDEYGQLTGLCGVEHADWLLQEQLVRVNTEGRLLWLEFPNGLRLKVEEYVHLVRGFGADSVRRLIQEGRVMVDSALEVASVDFQSFSEELRIAKDAGELHPDDFMALADLNGVAVSELLAEVGREEGRIRIDFEGHIVSLNISGKPVSDLSPLSGLRHLKYFYAMRCPIKTVESLANSVIEVLDMERSGLETFAGIERMQSLRCLHAGGVKASVDEDKMRELVRNLVQLETLTFAKRYLSRDHSSEYYDLTRWRAQMSNVVFDPRMIAERVPQPEAPILLRKLRTTDFRRHTQMLVLLVLAGTDLFWKALGEIPQGVRELSSVQLPITPPELPSPKPQAPSLPPEPPEPSEVPQPIVSQSVRLKAERPQTKTPPEEQPRAPAIIEGNFTIFWNPDGTLRRITCDSCRASEIWFEKGSGTECTLYVNRGGRKYSVNFDFEWPEPGEGRSQERLQGISLHLVEEE